MPPRKSDARKSDVSFADAGNTSTQPVDSQADDASKTTADKKDAVTIEDLSLPKSIITRLAKGVLPPNTQIQGNAILAISKSATVFINYLASHANENTMDANKKTIAPADVFKALEDTEFAFLKEPLEAEFAKFNAIQTEKRTSYRQKVKATKEDDTEMHDTSTISAVAGGDGETPPAKKARVNGAAADAEDTEVDEHIEDEDDDDEDDEDEEDEDAAPEEDEADEGSEDETQDAQEDKVVQVDEALDGDESD